MLIDCLGQTLNLNSPQIMGVLNITPDSFSDGGRFNQLDRALKQADLMIAAGANIIDIGGESTRPGAIAVTEEEELARVIPVIEQIANNHSVIISIDTSKPEVMRQAVHSGANLVNDINGLRAKDALTVVSELAVPVCLMHMQDKPATMQDKPHYKNVLQEVSEFFSERILACEEAGIDRQKIILDPGFGFGKTLEHNLLLLKNLNDFKNFKLPILAGLSRKSMFDQILGKAVDDRLFASLSSALLAVINGASIIRVHDVEPTADVLKVYSAMMAA